ncbi:hypothetical protein IMZ08_18280 [Bacillus luteolus]|uniref:Uncharacterized protein n=1 Tax=Litchfieldia luteola TaxID=682179 RepID=A0ABR9QNB2_9BACI|nr:hypothetical protein [Cytobacillus luteolus]MBE4909988.1 hypothetical protein [Cytobacillus luteolus]MBP1942453.1 hypothetical protein [Cytobacillus luteolus]
MSKTSPNPGLIQSGLAGREKNKSESKGNSDRLSERLTKQVRIQGLFGQVERDSSKTSTNSKVIRTG